MPHAVQCTDIGPWLPAPTPQFTYISSAKDVSGADCGLRGVGLIMIDGTAELGHKRFSDCRAFIRHDVACHVA